MRHEKRRDGQALLQPPDFSAHFNAWMRIKIGQGLIQQKHIGFDHQGARQRHALLLAARKLRRLAISEIRQRHHFKHGTRLLPTCRPAHAAHAQPESHIAQDIKMRK